MKHKFILPLCTLSSPRLVFLSKSSWSQKTEEVLPSSGNWENYRGAATGGKRHKTESTPDIQSSVVKDTDALYLMEPECFCEPCYC